MLIDHQYLPPLLLSLLYKIYIFIVAGELYQPKVKYRTIVAFVRVARRREEKDWVKQQHHQLQLVHCSTWPTPAHRLLLRRLIQNTETQHQSRLLLRPAVPHRPDAAVTGYTFPLFSLFVSIDDNSLIAKAA